MTRDYRNKKKEYPFVYIIILNWNSYEETIGCINSLEALAYPSFKILVIDNCSPDGSGQMLKNTMKNHEVVITGDNLGYAGGNNIGINRAIERDADYVWILNPDIRVEPESLSILIESMEKNLSIGAIGPRICDRDNRKKIFSDGGQIAPEEGYLTYHKNIGKDADTIASRGINLDVGYVNGSAILLRADALKNIGGFREELFLYFEETDWCMRARNQGWSVAIDTNALVYHQMSRQGFRQYFYMTRNHIWLSKINGNRYYGETIAYELNQFLIMLLKSYHKNAFINMSGKLSGIFSGIITSPETQNGIGSLSMKISGQ